jgi:beta-mannosidase
MDEQGNVLQNYPYSFGIRSVKLVQEADKWGTSFYFEINGKPVFMKGGNMIPPSMFGGVTTNAEWEKWVALMVESNFNMVRIWGGGDYASEVFLNACDRAGIMVWHDAMFACAMYPGSSAFLANVEEELHYQWPRITRHPSVVYINGNNEVDVAWKNWGFKLLYALNNSEQKKIEMAYDTLFRKLIPDVLAQYSNLPYVHTSPLSNWGKSEYYNHGTQHYWGVWHGTDPMKDFEKNIGRFNAEFGFQSFPEFSTLNSFSDTSDWKLNSKVMKHHQKSYVGNGMILKHAMELFGKPKSFEEFVYFAQLTQAHAVTSAVSGHLLDAPRCMGSLYWQINDCWPAPTWSSMDYCGNWKALHYKMKDVFRNVTVVQTNQNQRLSIVANNLDSINAKVSFEVYRLNNRTPVLIKREEQEFQLSNFESVSIFDASALKGTHVVKLRLNGGQEELFLFGTIKQLKPRKPGRNLLTVVCVDTLHKTGKLLIENHDFLADVWWYSMTPGVRFNRNFQHCLPGKHEVSFTFEEIPIQFKYYYR